MRPTRRLPGRLPGALPWGRRPLHVPLPCPGAHARVFDALSFVTLCVYILLWLLRVQGTPVLFPLSALRRGLNFCQHPFTCISARHAARAHPHPTLAPTSAQRSRMPPPTPPPILSANLLASSAPLGSTLLTPLPLNHRCKWKNSGRSKGRGKTSGGVRLGERNRGAPQGGRPQMRGRAPPRCGRHGHSVLTPVGRSRRGELSPGGWRRCPS